MIHRTVTDVAQLRPGDVIMDEHEIMGLWERRSNVFLVVACAWSSNGVIEFTMLDRDGLFVMRSWCWRPITTVIT